MRSAGTTVGHPDLCAWSATYVLCNARFHEGNSPCSEFK